MINFVIIVTFIPFVYFTYMIIFFLLYKKESNKYDKYTGLVDNQYTILTPEKLAEYSSIRVKKIDNILKLNSGNIFYFYKIYKLYKDSNKWMEDNLHEIDHFKLKNREKSLKNLGI